MWVKIYLKSSCIGILITVVSLNKQRLRVKLSCRVGISIFRLNAEHSSIGYKVVTFHYEASVVPYSKHWLCMSNVFRSPLINSLFEIEYKRIGLYAWVAWVLTEVGEFCAFWWSVCPSHLQLQMWTWYTNIWNHAARCQNSLLSPIISAVNIYYRCFIWIHREIKSQ